MRTRLYINNELCHDLTQLQDYVRSLSYGSEIYSDILEYALCGDLSAWLHEHGYEEIAQNVDSIDKTMGDTDFVNKLTNILLGKALPIKKPKYCNCFSCNISVPFKSSKEVVVLLSITPKMCVNENFEIKVSCGWCTKARVFNPSQYEENTVNNETITLHRRTDKEIGKIVVSIEDEQVFEESIQFPKTTVEHSVQSSSRTPRDEIVSFLNVSDAPKNISDLVRWVERASQIMEAKKSLTESDNIKSSKPKLPKEPEYIRTAGGLIPKEEWLRRREQERLARDESERKKEETLRQKEEEEEREAMIERWRRKHGM